MQLGKRRLQRKGDEAVSPVIGVMLMVVIVVIIAAVVSGFAGGLVAKSNQKAPTLSMDVKVLNTGYWQGSGFFATVTGVSEPIPTKDIRIVTSWKAAHYSTSHQVTTGGNTVVADSPNTNVLLPPITLNGIYVAPFGIGAGVNRSEIGGAAGTEGVSFSSPWQQFGNYTLMPGTTLTAVPLGAKDGGSFGEANHWGGYGGADNASYQYYVPERTQTCYQYYRFSTWRNIGCCDDPVSSSCSAYKRYQNYLKYYPGQTYQQTIDAYWQQVPTSTAGQYSYTANCQDSSCLDSVKAVLGTNWNVLREGDIVNVKVIYIPTGKVIFDQDIPVTEA